MNPNGHKPTYLESAELMLKEHVAYMRECAAAVLDDNITNFPVFIMHKGEISWGEDILSETPGTEWKIHLSTAEELIRLGVIRLEKARLFVTGFKNPREYACILAISREEGAHFIFYPYS